MPEDEKVESSRLETRDEMEKREELLKEKKKAQETWAKLSQN
jgi:hypothetical protein